VQSNFDEICPEPLSVMPCRVFTKMVESNNECTINIAQTRIAQKLDIPVIYNTLCDIKDPALET